MRPEPHTRAWCRGQRDTDNFSYHSWDVSGLLNCRQQPAASPRTHEGPKFGRLARAVAFNVAAGRTVDHPVVQRKTHGDRGIVGTAFAPRLRQVTLLKPHVGDFVDQTTAGIFRKLFGE